MNSYEFNSTKEFLDIIIGGSDHVKKSVLLSNVLEGIYKAFKEKEKEALVFTIEVGDSSLDMIIPIDSWESTLERLMDDFRELGDIDTSIDAFELLKLIKEEQSSVE